MIYTHTGRWMWHGSASVVSRNWENTPVIPNWFQPCQCIDKQTNEQTKKKHASENTSWELYLQQPTPDEAAFTTLTCVNTQTNLCKYPHWQIKIRKSRKQNRNIKLCLIIFFSYEPWYTNHKGLHQGWTQTSLYLQAIHFASHRITSCF